MKIKIIGFTVLLALWIAALYTIYIFADRMKDQPTLPDAIRCLLKKSKCV